MNYKRANRAFLGMVLAHFAAVAVLLLVSGFYTLGIVENLLLSELLMLLPAAAALFTSGDKPRTVLGFHRLKPGSVLMIVLYTLLCGPLTTLLNAVSMLFADNAVTAMSTDVLELPFWAAFLLIAGFGPFCEELCFRGILYRGYLKSGNAPGAVLLSSLLFGLMHMNFNQALYAFGLGIAMALLVEATGSLWSSVLMHMLFNAQSVILMYVYDRWFPEMWENQLTMQPGADQLLLVIGIYSVIAVASTALAGCVLAWLCRHQGRAHYVSWLAAERKRKGHSPLVSASLVTGCVLSLAYMIFVALL